MFPFMYRGRVSDANLAVDNGWYEIFGDISNAPFTQSWGPLFVIGNSYKVQFAFYSVSDGFKLYVRQLNHTNFGWAKNRFDTGIGILCTWENCWEIRREQKSFSSWSEFTDFVNEMPIKTIQPFVSNFNAFAGEGFYGNVVQGLVIKQLEDAVFIFGIAIDGTLIFRKRNYPDVSTWEDPKIIIHSNN